MTIIDWAWILVPRYRIFFDFSIRALLNIRHPASVHYMQPSQAHFQYRLKRVYTMLEFTKRAISSKAST